MVTKFPLRALFPLPNRVLPKLRAVTMEAHLSESQASKQLLKQMGKKKKKISSKFTLVQKFYMYVWFCLFYLYFTFYVLHFF